MDGKTHPTERDVYDRPDPKSSVLERELARYSVLPYVGSTHAAMTPENAALAEKLFTTLDPTFFVYGIADREQCSLRVGEPVVLIDSRTIMHANGHAASCD